ncbi:hypothetical protein J6590_062712 [Homalodisca vitripennis]|nr:hypothetical protein J6590_062712 [Homalodisca vitripennis]
MGDINMYSSSQMPSKHAELMALPWSASHEYHQSTGKIDFVMFSPSKLSSKRSVEMTLPCSCPSQISFKQPEKVALPYSLSLDHNRSQNGPKRLSGNPSNGLQLILHYQQPPDHPSDLMRWPPVPCNTMMARHLFGPLDRISCSPSHTTDHPAVRDPRHQFTFPLLHHGFDCTQESANSPD